MISVSSIRILDRLTEGLFERRDVSNIYITLRAEDAFAAIVCLAPRDIAFNNCSIFLVSRYSFLRRASTSLRPQRVGRSKGIFPGGSPGFDPTFGEESALLSLYK